MNKMKREIDMSIQDMLWHHKHVQKKLFFLVNFWFCLEKTKIFVLNQISQMMYHCSVLYISSTDY